MLLLRVLPSFSVIETIPNILEKLNNHSLFMEQVKSKYQKTEYFLI